MKYELAAIPTIYHGVRFRSRLEARWAAFADLAGWQWRYEPIELAGWIPDFWMSLPCPHVGCPANHELYVEVKPYRAIAEFEGHPVTRVSRLNIPSPALFGWHPSVTEWLMVHGGAAGIHSAAGWAPNAEQLWNEAGNRTQWLPPARKEIRASR